MLTRLLMLMALILAAPAWAADPSGSWAMQAGDVTITRILVERKAGRWTGVWERPAEISFDGTSFSGIRGPVERRVAFAAREVGDAVELSFTDPRPGATPDIFLIRARDAEHAELRYVGSGFEPFALIRAKPAALGPWDSAQRYTRTIERTTNPEMTAMFVADQGARSIVTAKTDWSVVARQDEARRTRTQALLDAGALASGTDFYHAAFIFQHGGAPADYLKAHVLATIAAARGRSDATWIAAATLDRYLMSIDKPQVFGTQSQSGPDGRTTQGDFDRTLISDALRGAMRVPTLAEQEARRRSMEDDRRKTNVPAR